MQDRYAGDIGDFGKYGLLRALCGEALRLGVLWYAFEGDRKRAPNDGKRIDYLDPPDEQLRECDPDPVPRECVTSCPAATDRSPLSSRAERCHRGLSSTARSFTSSALNDHLPGRRRGRTGSRGALMRLRERIWCSRIPTTGSKSPASIRL